VTMSMIYNIIKVTLLGTHRHVSFGIHASSSGEDPTGCHHFQTPGGRVRARLQGCGRLCCGTEVGKASPTAPVPMQAQQFPGCSSGAGAECHGPLQICIDL
jgi:hypothetical protein